MTQRVLLLQRILPAYRVPFVESVVPAADREGIVLDISFGQAGRSESPSSVPYTQVPAALPVRNYKTPLFPVVWQSAPVPDSYDLVIVEQANRLLLNYLWMIRRDIFGRPARLAYWAHGVNWQGRSNSLREFWKRSMRSRADFWFCYTNRVVDLLTDVPVERKCSIDNAIDTAALHAAISDANKTIAKDPLHLLFIGSMRADKRLDWIFAALDAAHARLEGVTAAFIGDGPKVGLVKQFCYKRTWATYEGSFHGEHTAPYLQRAAAILMPGLVGLVVLDSFVAEAPILTTPFQGRHSPEFAYADSGVNALMSEDNQADYSSMVISYLLDQELAKRLRSGCRAASGKYTIINMSRRFVEGMKRALSFPPRMYR